MADENPYAPPVETSEDYAPAPPQGGQLSLSAQGWEIVSGMSKWMRIVSGLQYAGAVLVGLGALFFISQSGRLIGDGGFTTRVLAVSAAVMVAYSLLLFFAASWLRQAASHFYQGVLSDHESPLAQGFRSLRLYLILYAIFSVVGLAGVLVKLALG